MSEFPFQPHKLDSAANNRDYRWFRRLPTNNKEKSWQRAESARSSSLFY